MLRALALLIPLLLTGCPDGVTRPAPGRARPAEAPHRVPEPRESAPPASSGAPEPSAPPSAPGSPWQSLRACEAEVAAGRRLPRAEGTARIGTWNVRWFPDGKPGRRAADVGTDVAWLGCAIAWLAVDVLAVQEIKNSERAQRSMAEVRRVLDRLTKGRWAIELDRCPNPHGQHVGLLYDASRVSLKDVATLPSLNPHGEACKDSLRPGFGGYLKFPGGLDLHLVAIHAKSGSERRSADLRLESLRGIDAAVQTLGALHSDSDIVLAGDFNTMGCRRCSPSVSPAQELATTDRLLAGVSTPMRRVPASAPCSEFYGRGGTLLDHFVVSRSLSELDPGTRAVVSGLCGETACATASPKKTDFVTRLSDHCPVVLDLRDRDVD